ncbi:hypothetical protein K438DRAFT_642652 [Mycena galopus ATCC 62051]|nr:hypothetical protein K438DRAFT_642652 [Mycena galopus ATCC 62051]
MWRFSCSIISLCCLLDSTPAQNLLADSMSQLLLIPRRDLSLTSCHNSVVTARIPSMPSCTSQLPSSLPNSQVPFTPAASASCPSLRLVARFLRFVLRFDDGCCPRRTTAFCFFVRSDLYSRASALPPPPLVSSFIQFNRNVWFESISACSKDAHISGCRSLV